MTLVPYTKLSGAPGCPRRTALSTKPGSVQLTTGRDSARRGVRDAPVTAGGGGCCGRDREPARPASGRPVRVHAQRFHLSVVSQGQSTEGRPSRGHVWPLRHVCKADADGGMAGQVASVPSDRPRREPRVPEAGGTCPGQCPVSAERLWHPRDRVSAAGRTRSRTLSGTLPGRVPLPHNAQCGSFPGVPPTPLCARGDILCSQNHPGLSERRLTLPWVRTP